MILTLEDIKTVTFGAESICENEGRVCFHRFTDKEREGHGSHEFLSTAGVQMEFMTDATALRLKGTIKEASGCRSFYAIDILKNGEHIHSIKNYKEEELNSEYANYKYPFEDFDSTIALGEGSKSIRIVLPFSVICEFQTVELVDATYIKSIQREKRIVAYGDSITQGYDSLNPKDTYVMRMAEYFGANIINKGIGGMQFQPEMSASAYDSKPDFITVAYGTNDWNWNDLDTIRNSCISFLDNLIKIYENAPIFIIAPIWRISYKEQKPAGDFSNVEKMIFEVAEKYPRVTAISGWELVPHDLKYFGDGGLHPASNGFECYFENLKKFLPEK